MRPSSRHRSIHVAAALAVALAAQAKQVEDHHPVEKLADPPKSKKAKSNWALNRERELQAKRNKKGKGRW